MRKRGRVVERNVGATGDRALSRGFDGTARMVDGGRGPTGSHGFGRDFTAVLGGLAVAAALAALSGGCAAGDLEGDTDRIVRTDSAGIEIVTSRAPRWGAGEDGWRIEAEPELEIGSIDGGAEETLHQIVTVRSAEDGILVAQATELRIYDEAGRFVRRVGGEGDGPGEFRRVASALPCGDRLLATDVLAPRLTVFAASGEPRTTDLPPPAQPGWLTPLYLRDCASDDIVAVIAGERQPSTTPPTIQRYPRYVVRLTILTGGLDTLAVYPMSESFDGLSVPFGRTTVFDAASGNIYLSDTGGPEIRVLRPDGEPHRIIRLELAARAVTDTDIDRIRGQYLDGVPATIAAEIEPRFDAVSIPETMPYFSRLRVSPDGTIWLRDYQPFRDQEVTGWTLVDPSGEWLGHIELPAGLDVHEVGPDYVLGVWRDELDVEYVRRYRIRR